MSFYPPDGDIFYGWKSFGRSFAFTGIVAFALAVLAFCAHAGLFPLHLTAAESLLAFLLCCIGAAISILMLVCGLGSMKISHQERGGVEVTPLGVRRILNSSGQEDFFPIEEIAGMYARAEGGLALFDGTYQRQMLVPRSIEGYRDCVAELKAMGIPVIVPPKLIIGKPYRPPPTWRQRILNWLIMIFFIFSGNIAFDRHAEPWLRHLFSVLLLAGALVWMGFNVLRKQGSSRFEKIFFGLLLLLLLVLL
jgi:hypothetical protein